MVIDGDGKSNPSEAYSSSIYPQSRADETEHLLRAVQAQIIPFIRSADQEIERHRTSPHPTDATKEPPSSLVIPLTLSELHDAIPLSVPTTGLGPSGLLSTLKPILKYSVNTFSPGFLDKLYASTNAPGLAADLILSALNTNLHVYQVSPVLTLIEKYTAKTLAHLFGFNGPRAGGISVQGGSASNLTSITIARNSLYPDTKIYGNNHSGRQLTLFTSAHGHYSIEKSAQALGFGSAAVISIPVSPLTGAMNPAALEVGIIAAKKEGKTPFYVSATAGTTVLGSFDPFPEIGAIARKHGMWFHIDSSWGGPFIFSEKLKYKLAGSELADSIAINPHKMIGVPVTCSFLLAKDLRQFHRANTLPADYLFHGDDCNSSSTGDLAVVETGGAGEEDNAWAEPNDLADLTLQCGRRGDSLKLFLSWQYYGTAGYASQVENAHSVATHMADLISRQSDAVLISENPPPCLQVCFYFAPNSKSVFGSAEDQLQAPSPSSVSSAVTSTSNSRGDLSLSPEKVGKYNSLVTERITKALVGKGFMIDYAPALEGRESEGKFFRVVINVQTERATVERLMEEVMAIGRRIWKDLSLDVGRRHVTARHQDDAMTSYTRGVSRNQAETGHEKTPETSQTPTPQGIMTDSTKTGHGPVIGVGSGDPVTAPSGGILKNPAEKGHGPVVDVGSGGTAQEPISRHSDPVTPPPGGIFNNPAEKGHGPVVDVGGGTGEEPISRHSDPVTPPLGGIFKNPAEKGHGPVVNTGSSGSGTEDGISRQSDPVTPPAGGIFKNPAEKGHGPVVSIGTGTGGGDGNQT